MLIDRYFPMVEVSVSAQMSRAPNARTISSIHPWPTRRHVSLCAAISALAGIDDDNARDAISDAVVNKLPIFPNSIVRQLNGLTAIDTMCGGGSSIAGMLTVGIDAYGSDINPVAVIASKLATEYLVLDKLYVNKLEKYFGELAEHLSERLKKFYPGDDLVAYIWSNFATCEYCRNDYPLVLSSIICKGEGGQYYNIDFDKNSMSIVIKPGESDVLRTIYCKKTTCPWCEKENDYGRLIKLFKNGLIKERPIGAILKVKGGFAARQLNLAEISAINEADNIAKKLMVENSGMFNAVDACIPERVLKRLHSYRKWTDVLNPGQTLILLESISFMRDRIVPLYASSEIGESVVVGIAAIIARMVSSNNKFRIFSPNKLGYGGAFITTVYPQMAWSYVELSLSATLKCGMNIIHSMKNALRGYVGQKANIIVRDATKLDATIGQFDFAIIDPPYNKHADYITPASFFGFIYGLTIPSEVMHNIGMQDSSIANSLVGVDGASTMWGDGDESGFKAFLTESLVSLARVVKQTGRVVIIWGNKLESGWRILIDAIRASGWKAIRIWPAVAEHINRPGIIYGGTNSCINGIIVLAREYHRTGGEVDVDWLWNCGFSGSDIWVMFLDRAIGEKHDASGEDVVKRAKLMAMEWSLGKVEFTSNVDLDNAIIALYKRLRSISSRGRERGEAKRLIDEEILSKWPTGFEYMQLKALEYSSGKSDSVGLASSMLLFERMRYKLKEYSILKKTKTGKLL